MGSYTSVMNNTNATMYIKYTYAFGAKLGALPHISNLIADAFGASSADVIGATSHATDSRIIASRIDEKLRKDGFSCILPGYSHVSQKLPLSLVHRANIILVQRRNEAIAVRRGTMTVWSGPTGASTRRYTANDCRYELETVLSV